MPIAKKTWVDKPSLSEFLWPYTAGAEADLEWNLTPTCCRGGRNNIMAAAFAKADGEKRMR